MEESTTSAMQLCTSCKQQRGIDQFKQGKDGKVLKTCRSCLARYAQNYTAKKGLTAKEPKFRDSDNDTDFDGLSELSLQIFLEAVEEAQDEISLAACVDISSLKEEMGYGKDLLDYAKELAKKIQERSQYCFIYHSLYESKREPHIRYMFTCAQSKEREHKSKKGGKEGAQSRDRRTMPRFDCHGWLHMTLHINSPSTFIKITHQDHHVPYYCIDVPKEVQNYVLENLDMTPQQLWGRILTKIHKPNFSQRAIYYLWSKHNSRKWTLDSDELQSAKSFLRTNGDVVKEIPLHEEPGFKALAFSLPEILEKWGSRIREISLDSSWKTNGSNFEIFALLGELHGSGCPLGYLFIKSDQSGQAGGKERFITEFLAHFKSFWKINAIVTLTDKDQSEINAFRKVFPHAKHQLCFWHCLRAIRSRLSILRRQPKFYDVLEARKEFLYIDETFIPIAQVQNPLPLKDSIVPEKSIPRLKVLFNNQFVDKPPHSQTPLEQRLKISLGGVVQSIVRLPSNHADEYLPEDDADILDEVDKLVNSGRIDEESEDGPEWMFDHGEALSKDVSYAFCPAAHRHQLLHLFTSHFCQHPIFPLRRGDFATASQIRAQAVWEMYSFCRTRNLREVWGYMWTSWYRPEMWKIWARSTTEYLSRLRTTMNVENFWQQLKHDYLHHVTRPRIDQLAWILARRVTPAYLVRFESLEPHHRLGRVNKLTTHQEYFKRAWKKLESATTSGATYKTDVANWTCNCGRQMYDPHHLCKHLVQAVMQVPPEFFCEIVRRRKAPIYRHPALVSRIAPTSVDVHGSRGEDGSVTDGDEVDRIVKHDVLCGGGGWNRILEHQSAVSTKRKERTEEMEYEPSKVPKLSDSDSGLIDLTMDSSNSEPDTHPGSSSDYFGLDDDDDELSRPCFKYAEGHGVDRKPARKPSSLGLDMAQESASEQMDKRH
ncbi:hypothetical protein Agabi119p4_3346 [Agaricus bisporus var. burnettii]|uniref:SWIM-type domain-containing protein n=1 Tax=Agaricus bisporus var. burnettii TaxID=192524 RepID=A0A8H7KJA6_AGABI|nr:hypothetical protein Agabi119p4_3346 [Agaricus bisporus var. burnettii]